MKHVDPDNTFNVRRMADPTGTGLKGHAPGYDLTRGAAGHPQILWLRKDGKDVLLEADVYTPAGQPMSMYINCPICAAEGRRVQLRITQDQKPFTYGVDREPPPFPGWTRERMRGELGRLLGAHGPIIPDGWGGTVTIHDPIRCTFEANPSLRTSVDPLCPWRVRIENNVARDV